MCTTSQSFLKKIQLTLIKRVNKSKTGHVPAGLLKSPDLPRYPSAKCPALSPFTVKIKKMPGGKWDPTTKLKEMSWGKRKQNNNKKKSLLMLVIHPQCKAKKEIQRIMISCNAVKWDAWSERIFKITKYPRFCDLWSNFTRLHKTNWTWSRCFVPAAVSSYSEGAHCWDVKCLFNAKLEERHLIWAWIFSWLFMGSAHIRRQFWATDTYLSHDLDVCNEAISNAMRRNCFDDIMVSIHLVDNSKAT